MALRFVADCMLGKLARLLRTLGYSVDYFHDADDVQVVDLAISEKAILLTRDIKLLERRPLPDYIFIRDDNSEMQLIQVIKELAINPDSKQWFSICLNCNSPLRIITKKEAAGLVPVFTYSKLDIFARCDWCNKIYWPGTHSLNMRKRLAALISAASK